ncbi:MAG: peptidoglycan DD-metalloendopeptidase family protein [Nitrospirae bacterium]|nr:peptidoglycan DD-metalloendopeptidase family protein [Nitrospirota bacterium]
MMDRKIIGIVLTIGLLLIPSFSFSESLSKKKEELERLKKELSEKRKIEKEIKKNEFSILNEFEKIDKKWIVEKKELRDKERSIKQIDKDIALINQQVENSRKKTDEKKVIINARIRRIYKEDKMGDLLLLAGGRNYQDLMTRIHSMFEISRNDMTALKEYHEGMLVLKEKEDLLEAKRREIVGMKQQASDQMEALQNEKMNKNMLLAKVRIEKELAGQAIKELEESTLKVQELMRQLQQHPSARSGFLSEKGKLPWPASGKVVGAYGRQKHPKFDFYVFKKGWEIKPAENDAIRSIYDGVVVYGDWFKGYGLLIIIDHGAGYYSLYAHASKLMVGAGEKVGQNQVIGEIGETGYSEERNLYFEIRHGGNAVDPSLWLAKKQ